METFNVTTPAGTFTFAGDLTIRERIRLRPLAEEIYGEPIPEGDGNLHADLAFVLAELQTACRQAPAGWDWEKLTDVAALVQVWEGYQSNGATFRAGVDAHETPASA
jgi:hypothetical protein